MHFMYQMLINLLEFGTGIAKGILKGKLSQFSNLDFIQKLRNLEVEKCIFIIYNKNYRYERNGYKL